MRASFVLRNGPSQVRFSVLRSRAWTWLDPSYRSDFAKLVELFDEHDVSFISVTQSGAAFKIRHAVHPMSEIHGC
jgi:hypothetical protein